MTSINKTEGYKKKKKNCGWGMEVICSGFQCENADSVDGPEVTVAKASVPYP